MKPKVVLVETNWVVDVIAPAHLQSPQAARMIGLVCVNWILIFNLGINLVRASLFSVNFIIALKYGYMVISC